MTKVTVDHDDLETIIFATAAIKAIEGALAARKTDPFVRPHLDYTAAHDRLATAMRNAKRAENQDTLVKFDDPLTGEEMAALTEVHEATTGKYASRFMVLSRKKKAPEDNQAMSVYDQLSAKGCVQMGVLVHGVIWAGAASPELESEAAFGIKLTDRGREKLEKKGYAQ